ncbi:MAG: di-trans,poly-cis-decaprenylcistransferase, partial [Thiotrichaceae bacterium]|nr:di-trans,poly-cis-decaprenylcistransferase [Thiotrichaceae bacterium]
DGNGRWAQNKFLPRHAGHKAGVETVRRILSLCVEQNIEVLTLFTFSSENWRRPEEEVNLLIKLFITALERELNKLHKNNVRLRIIGARDAFSDKLQQVMANAEKVTQHNSGITLVIAANYGGHWDIVEATKRLSSRVEQGILRSQDITENLLTREMCLGDLPEPDLFIRTGGEQRISNFLLWQLAYTELYFTDILWPDFDKDAFNNAMTSFAERQRRFGQTSEQLETNNA